MSVKVTIDGKADITVTRGDKYEIDANTGILHVCSDGKRIAAFRDWAGVGVIEDDAPTVNIHISGTPSPQAVADAITKRCAYVHSL